MDKNNIANRFSYHPPKDKETIELHEEVRAHAKRFAERLDYLLPEGREKAIAITKLEECLMWSNAAIAREPKN